MRVETYSLIVGLVSIASALALMPPSRCHAQDGASVGNRATKPSQPCTFSEIKDSPGRSLSCLRSEVRSAVRDLISDDQIKRRERTSNERSDVAASQT